MSLYTYYIGDMIYENIIGQNLKKFRRQLGLTMDELAEKAHLTADNIYRYENSRAHPNYASIRRLCKALNVTASELLGF